MYLSWLFSNKRILTIEESVNVSFDETNPSREEKAIQFHENDADFSPKKNQGFYMCLIPANRVI